ncbi:NADPH-dependent FMN reductase [Halobacteroides halobius DSM 5150]|uniref:NADPH-dependent FMN reductase n=1 Tax=Halobacteroides halobius (strain ATCC 35273 / DSM 5150 / MD-1) TaxID=748449 RepID=L0KB66_HALHC|nr:flavodoxin family protein [Halobacteroides halobius]AGB41629.1 NADPH-dependent FMN reductase [Halobacteroides halobius DSM 5150]
MKKVVGFIGSARKTGNTSSLVKQILQGAKDEGVETKNYYLNELNIKGCQGCMYCRKHNNCCIKDDMQEVYQDIKDAEAVIIGSPIYIHQVSGQTKLMLDRFYPLTNEKHKPRFGKKKLVMAYTQAAPFKCFFKKYRKYIKKSLKAMGLIHHKDIVATRCFESDAVKKNKKVLNKAYKLGNSLFE